METKNKRKLLLVAGCTAALAVVAMIGIPKSFWKSAGQAPQNVLQDGGRFELSLGETKPLNFEERERRRVVFSLVDLTTGQDLGGEIECYDTIKKTKWNKRKVIVGPDGRNYLRYLSKIQKLLVSPEGDLFLTPRKKDVFKNSELCASFGPDFYLNLNAGATVKDILEVPELPVALTWTPTEKKKFMLNATVTKVGEYQLKVGKLRKKVTKGAKRSARWSRILTLVVSEAPLNPQGGGETGAPANTGSDHKPGITPVPNPSNNVTPNPSEVPTDTVTTTATPTVTPPPTATPTVTPIPPVCGDSNCESEKGETAESCNMDCPGTCGDNFCNPNHEDYNSCPGDCVNHPPLCRDGTCSPEAGEDYNSCPEDCPDRCGDSICSSFENPDICPQDCGTPCNNNGQCEAGENAENCSNDCGGTVCGNGQCEQGETQENCPGDCPICATEDAVNCSNYGAIWDDGSCACRCPDSASGNTSMVWQGNGCGCADGQVGDGSSGCCEIGSRCNCAEGQRISASGICEEGPTPTPTKTPDPVCGDSNCESEKGESAESCNTDCPGTCGDGFCNPNFEDYNNCGADCTDHPPICSDGTCNGDENPSTCPGDCPDICGDSYCSGSENSDYCPEDCGPACNSNGQCENGETQENCPGDCPICATEDAVNCSNYGAIWDDGSCSCRCPDSGTTNFAMVWQGNGCGCSEGQVGDTNSGCCNIGTQCNCPEGQFINAAGYCQEGPTPTPTKTPDPVCGNSNCDSGEDFNSCPQDCQSICGDGYCSQGEDPSSCPSDCGASCGDGSCDPSESPEGCPQDCGGYCNNNGYCDSGENESNCSNDCRTCPPQDAVNCTNGGAFWDESSCSCSCNPSAGAGSQMSWNGTSCECPEGTVGGSLSDCCQIGTQCNCPSGEVVNSEGICSLPETAVPTPTTGQYCGNGVCDGEEDVHNCPQECQRCRAPDGSWCESCNWLGGDSNFYCCPYPGSGDTCCGPDATADYSSMGCVPKVEPTVVPIPVGSVCGDNQCTESETCSTCEADCGACQPVEPDPTPINSACMRYGVEIEQGSLNLGDWCSDNCNCSTGYCNAGNRGCTTGEIGVECNFSWECQSSKCINYRCTDRLGASGALCGHTNNDASCASGDCSNAHCS
jgi:hypothetical protein